MNSPKEHGTKLVEKAFAGKVGHRILLIGSHLSYSHVEKEIARDDAEISYYTDDEMRNADRLLDYTLCIVDYRAIENEYYKNLFIKQLHEASEYGTNICVVYYQDPVGKSLGTEILSELNLAKPYDLQKVIHDGKATQNEFNSYIKKWGSSKVAFRDVASDSVICKKDDVILGFSANVNKAKIIYLPFVRNASRHNELKEGFEILIDSLLTYISRSRMELPDWAKNISFFSDEEKLIEEKRALQTKLSDIDVELQKFDEAKSLLFQNEHNLEITLPKFLESHLGLNIEQNETYKEDFWLVDDKGTRLAIAEIKSKTKGFNKGLVHYVLSHKEAYDLRDDFPALLFVNCNLQASAWKDKDKLLNAEECKYVAQQNILVIRAEDIVRLWDAKRLGKISEKEILDTLLKNKGWLYVTKDLKVECRGK